MSDTMTAPAVEDQDVTGATAPTRRTTNSVPATKTPRARKGITAADVRAVLRKQQELAAATDEQLAMLSDALGKPGADITDLTVTILTSPRIDLGAITDLADIGDRDGVVKRAIAAMQLTADRPRAKAVWHLLVSLGVVQGKAPGNDGDLAEGIATAVDRLSDEHVARLDAITSLASR